MKSQNYRPEYHNDMTFDHDLEHGASQQRVELEMTSIPLRDDNQKTTSMPTNLQAGDTSNTIIPDSVMTTVFTFDKNGKRCVHEQFEIEETSPLLPCLKIVLRQLHARRFDNELLSDKKNLAFATEGNAQEAADSDAEGDKIARSFFLGMFTRNTNKVPAPPYLGIWELFGLWKQDGNDWFWINDPIFVGENLEMEVLYEPRLLRRSHILYLTKYGSAFCVSPSAMRMKILSEKHLQGINPRSEWLTLNLPFQTDLSQF